MSGWKKRAAVLIAACVGLFSATADRSSGALAQASGGSGYSGVLSSNRQIRKHQLICDPAEGGTSGGAPVSGSTSVSYDPGLVTISGFQFGPGFTGQAFVELRDPTLQTRSHRFFETIANYLGDRKTEPNETETGFIQVVYAQNGTPGQMSPDRGFKPIDSAGVNGVDTHSLTFTYLPGTPDTAVSTYRIFADPGGRPSGGRMDTLTGVGADGKPFTLGPSQLSSATVSGNLIGPAVPLPPAAWTGLFTLAGLFAWAGLRRKSAA